MAGSPCENFAPQWPQLWREENKAFYHKVCFSYDQYLTAAMKHQPCRVTLFLAVFHFHLSCTGHLDCPHDCHDMVVPSSPTFYAQISMLVPVYL